MPEGHRQRDQSEAEGHAEARRKRPQKHLNCAKSHLAKIEYMETFAKWEFSGAVTQTARAQRTDSASPKPASNRPDNFGHANFQSHADKGGAGERPKKSVPRKTQTGTKKAPQRVLSPYLDTIGISRFLGIEENTRNYVV